MLDLKYGSGFYIIKVTTDQYDLFNSATDKRILMDEPKEKIINFLELNSPLHPFLVKTKQESDSKYYSDYFRYVSDEDISKYQFSKIDISRHAPEDEGPTEMDDPCYFVDDKYTFSYADTADYDDLFNYDNPDDCFVIDEEGLRKEGSSNTQLEFSFTYKSKEDNNLSSPDNKEENIPYLPSDTEDDTE